MKKLLILLITVFSISTKAQDILSMRCITSGSNVPVKIYSDNGIQVTSDVDHIEVRPGDLLVIPRLSESTDSSQAIEVIHQMGGGG